MTLSASQVTALTDVIAAVKLFIDNYVGKTFESAVATRYYNGIGRREIMIDSFTTASMGVEILNINGSTQRTLTRGPAGDYLTYPYNQTEKNMLVVSRNGALGSFPKGLRNIRVSAKFGASDTVPADISLVASKLSWELLLTDTPDGTQITSIKLGDYQASYGLISEKAQSIGVFTILDSYRDIEI